jgi:hypothetical protein
MLCRARKSHQSEDRPPHPSASAIASSLAGGSGEAEPVTLRSRLEEASNSILQLPGGGSFMSRLGLVSASMTKHPAAAAAPVGASSSSPLSIPGFFVHLRPAPPPPSLALSGMASASCDQGHSPLLLLVSGQPLHSSSHSGLSQAQPATQPAQQLPAHPAGHSPIHTKP